MKRRPTHGATIRLGLLGLFGAALACAPDVPAEPTWTEDVMPIVRANCTRCHGAEPSGGAPVSFQLDRPSDHDDRWGNRIRGALTLDYWIGQRLVRGPDMPPNGPPLSDRQVEIVSTWGGRSASEDPVRGPGNKPPRFVLTEPLQANVDLGTSIHTFAEDREDDVIDGELWYGVSGPEVMINDELRSGVDEHLWDTRSVRSGTYHVFAKIFDESRRPANERYVDQRDLGEVTVAHASGTTLPFVTFERLPKADATCGAVDTFPRLDQLYHQEFVDPARRTIRVLLHDPDPGPLTVTFRATRKGLADADKIPLTVTNLVVNADAPACFAQAVWDVAADTDVVQGNWQIEVSVSQAGEEEAIATSPYFIVSRFHDDENISYQTVQERILGSLGVQCQACHQPRGYIPEVTLDSGAIDPWLGRIYRRVVERQDMPPRGYNEDFVPEQADRELLGRWILGGGRD